ncbi:hypothetical protein QY049_20500 [Bradyrhizobium sp. WYCCWR 13022]|uniref:hypothetical protein n=1 Tax=unclassified Bradyrhizobium TaxID=2631580 RepID=UPI00263BD121|nr:hypothetical protein [Bradyrhizobium sp. WYCCWR 13022]MDN4985547.1 hypothetical protein [Bradyrhizobium sp. WYCCWR 13022]
MPSPKQMEKLAASAAVGTNGPLSPAVGPGDRMSAEYWDAVLKDASADERQVSRPIQSSKVSQIGRHVLRVACNRCSSIVEIQKADAVRLYGPDAVWKEVGQRLLDATCQQRTARHEEDGCWPSFD